MKGSLFYFPAARWTHRLHVGDWYTETLNQPIQSGSPEDLSAANELMLCDARERMKRLLRDACCYTINTGAPPKTRICWVGGERGFWGAAGFKDSPESLDQPYMLLHESIADLDAIADGDLLTAYRVFIGVCIHEAGHLTYTHKSYRFDPDMVSTTRERLFVNLLEDNRIESLVANDLIGWRPYLMAARTKLHAEAFAPIAEQWHDMRASEKAAVLATLMIRSPERITDFQIADAQQPECKWLDRLASILHEAASTETQVWRMAVAINEFLQELDDVDGKTNDDYIFVPDATAAEESPASIWRNSDFSETPIADLFAVAERLGNALEDNLNEDDVLDDCIAESRDVAVKTTYDHQSSGRVIWSVAEKKGGGPIGNFLFPGFPAVVAQLRAAWAVPPQQRRVCQYLRAGKLDRRRLHAAAYDSRLFQNVEESKPRKPTDLVLLLDASGSMTGQRHEFATQAGILVTEAFHDHPGVDLHVFSHSAGFRLSRRRGSLLSQWIDVSGDDCVFITHLFGGDVTDRSWHESYELGYSNEDYTAIESVADAMAKRKTLHRPILMVISDGEPCGDTANGQSPVTQTRSAVESLRNQGWRVFSFGLGNEQACETIYGRQFTRQVDHEAELPRVLRNLVVQCSRTS